MIREDVVEGQATVILPCLLTPDPASRPGARDVGYMARNDRGIRPGERR